MIILTLLGKMCNGVVLMQVIVDCEQAKDGGVTWIFKMCGSGCKEC